VATADPVDERTEIVTYDEGRQRGHVDSSTIVGLQIGVPVAAGIAAVGVYAWRRGHLDPLLLDRDGAECPGCGRSMDEGEPSCPSCGEPRP
jgi:hypothetical protein